MGFNTRAFAAQDAIVDTLQAVGGLSAWVIEYGFPNVKAERHIWVDESINNGEQETVASGAVRTANESFRLDVFIYDRKTGASAREIRDEISTAAELVANALAAAPFLGGSVLYAEVVGFEYDGAFADAKGSVREGVMKLTVACSAYLTA